MYASQGVRKGGLATDSACERHYVVSRYLLGAAFDTGFLSLATTAVATAPPLVLVTENGGVSSGAPNQHRLAIYADGTVITGSESGSIDREDAREIARGVFKAIRGGSNDQRAKGLAISRITA
jgi:hypothetical protein